VWDVIRKNYENTASKGKLTIEQVRQRMGLLKPTLSYDDLRDADLIIEAVFETMAIKKEVFAKLDKGGEKKGRFSPRIPPISPLTKSPIRPSRPGDVVGMHFLSPANVIAPAGNRARANTAQDVLVTVVDIAKRINKVGVVCGNRDGFIGNRMLGGYAYQAS